MLFEEKKTQRGCFSNYQEQYEVYGSHYREKNKSMLFQLSRAIREYVVSIIKSNNESMLFQLSRAITRVCCFNYQEQYEVYGSHYQEQYESMLFQLSRAITRACCSNYQEQYEVYGSHYQEQ